MKFYLLIFPLMMISNLLTANIRPMFHPYEPTLLTIGQWVNEAQDTIDIALYSIDFTDKNPVIQALQSDDFQRKVKAGSMKVRLIYEGYKGREQALAVSRQFESLGIDVRFISSGRKVHHKFAILDFGDPSARLVTGSANWSLKSRNHYNESLLFIEQEQELISSFQREFNLLWSASEDTENEYPVENTPNSNGIIDQEGVEAYFNSANFKFSGRSIRIDPESKGYKLTREIVKAIDQAKSSIHIATTRIKLRPIYQAIARAAARGVKIKIIVNMDQYAYKNQRKNWKLKDCMDEYDKNCSEGINFSYHLFDQEYRGKENVELRIKIFNINPFAYLTKQMHSKYLVVDGRDVYTGSFNWSFSGEYRHFENLVYFDGRKYPEALSLFQQDFEKLFRLGREQYWPFIKRLEEAIDEDTTTSCKFEPMALSFDEIDYLFDTEARKKSEESLRLKVCA